MRIFHRLLLAFLAVSAGTLLLLALSTQWRLNRDFLAYSNALDEALATEVVGKLETDLNQNQSLQLGPQLTREAWADLWGVRRSQLIGLPGESAPYGRRPGDGRTPHRDSSPRGSLSPEPAPRPRHPPESKPPPPASAPGPPPAPTGQLLANRANLIDSEGRRIGGLPLDETANVRQLPIVVSDETVGYLQWAALARVEGGPALAMLRSQQQGMVISLGLLLIFATTLALWIARHFSRPVQKIAHASSRLALRDFETRVDIDRSDEIGDLARQFNFLARSMGRFDQARQQSMADIAHELRTPLTVIRGQLEAMVDGIRPMDVDGLNVVVRRAAGLAQMIDDLNSLAQSESGSMTFQMQSFDIIDLLDQVVGEHQATFAAAGVGLIFNRPDSVIVFGDTGRLEQVFNNLLNNARAYTDAPGRVLVAGKTEQDMVIITLDDTPPAPPKTDLAQLDQPFFRGSNAMSSRPAGSGLGLAICARIVAGHGGDIAFEKSGEGGLRVVIRIPAKS